MISGPSELVGKGKAGDVVDDGSVGVGTVGTASDVDGDAEASGGGAAEEVSWAEVEGSRDGAMEGEGEDAEGKGDAMAEVG